MSVEYTAKGQGYYRVYVDGEERSKHLTEREALENATNYLCEYRDNEQEIPECIVKHDYEVDVTINAADITMQVGDGGVLEHISNPDAPIISQPPNAEITHGDIFSYTPSLSQGSDVFWFKEYGPDTLTVDQETGAIDWNTTNLPRGQGILVGLGCSNIEGEYIAWFVIHVDNTGTSQLYVMGVDTIATTINAASNEISTGDTLVIPADSYYANITGTDSGENTFGDTSTYDPVAGSATQMTTYIGAGEVIIDFGPHDSIIRHQDIGLDLLGIAGSGTPGNWIKWCSIEFTGPDRQAINNSGDNNVMELVGATDAGYAEFPTTFVEAEEPFTSLAAGYQHGDNCVWENCYAFGQFRYGLQRGQLNTGSLTHRNIVRPDEYHGDQPRGGITHYNCEDIGVYNNFVIDADREDLAPFYKNYAGAFATPGTDNYDYATYIDMDGNMAINTHMLWGYIESHEEIEVARNDNVISISCRSTITPQTGSESDHFRSDHIMTINGLTMYQPESWDDTDMTRHLNAGRTGNSVDISNAIFHQPGWDDSLGQTIAVGSLINGTTSDLTNFCVYDNKDSDNETGGATTGKVSYSALDNGLDYPVRVEDGSPLDVLGIGADITNFKSPSNLIPGDTGWQTATDIWAWPHPAEQRIRTRMRTYAKSDLPVRHATVGTNPTDFTGSITGQRGFCANSESFSEYVWGQFGVTIPPLRVSAKITGTNEVTFRVGKYRSDRGDTITKFNLYETTDMDNEIKSFTGLKTTITGITAAVHSYVIRAVDTTYSSAWDANETGESGNSRTMTIDNGSFLVGNLTLNGSVDTTSLSETGGGNAGSDIEWVPENSTYLVVENNVKTLFEYASDLDTLSRTISISGTSWDDIEGVCWMGNNEVATCSENGSVDYVIDVYDWSSTGSSFSQKQELIIAANSSANNSGLEGLCWCESRNCWYAVGEGEQSGADRRFFKVIRPTLKTIDYDYIDSELVVTEPWNAETVFNAYGATGAQFDLSGMTYHEASDTVIIISRNGDKLVQLRPETGDIVSDLDIPSGHQWEGVAFRNNSNNMVITSEGAKLQLLDNS